MKHYIKEASIKHQSYLQDTPHFLRVVPKLNFGRQLPDNSCLVTSDIIGAYANIPPHCRPDMQIVLIQQVDLLTIGFVQ